MQCKAVHEQGFPSLLIFFSEVLFELMKKKTLLRQLSRTNSNTSISLGYFLYFFPPFFSRESHNSLVVAKWHDKYK